MPKRTDDPPKKKRGLTTQQSVLSWLWGRLGGKADLDLGLPDSTPRGSPHGYIANALLSALPDPLEVPVRAAGVGIKTKVKNSPALDLASTFLEPMEGMGFLDMIEGGPAVHAGQAAIHAVMRPRRTNRWVPRDTPFMALPGDLPGSETLKRAVKEHKIDDAIRTSDRDVVFEIRDSPDQMNEFTPRFDPFEVHAQAIPYWGDDFGINELRLKRVSPDALAGTDEQLGYRGARELLTDFIAQFPELRTITWDAPLKEQGVGPLMRFIENTPLTSIDDILEQKSVLDVLEPKRVSGDLRMDDFAPYIPEGGSPVLDRPPSEFTGRGRLTGPKYALEGPGDPLATFDSAARGEVTISSSMRDRVARSGRGQAPRSVQERYFYDPAYRYQPGSEDWIKESLMTKNLPLSSKQGVDAPFNIEGLSRAELDDYIDTSIEKSMQKLGDLTAEIASETPGSPGYRVVEEEIDKTAAWVNYLEQEMTGLYEGDFAKWQDATGPMDEVWDAQQSGRRWVKKARERMSSLEPSTAERLTPQLSEIDELEEALRKAEHATQDYHIAGNSSEEGLKKLRLAEEEAEVLLANKMGEVSQEFGPYFMRAQRMSNPSYMTDNSDGLLRWMMEEGLFGNSLWGTLKP